MAGKLKLDLDDLQVESFDTTVPPPELQEGTVYAYEEQAVTWTRYCCDIIIEITVALTMDVCSEGCEPSPDTATPCGSSTW